MKPCKVGFKCTYCLTDNIHDKPFCVQGELDPICEIECPLVEEYSSLFYWLHNCDNPVVMSLIDKLQKDKDGEAQKLCDKMLHRRMRIEEHEKKE